jgi:predicted dehydrogenase
MGRIRIGLIGAGFAAHIHARAYERLADLDVELAAVAAVPENDAQIFARDHGIPDSSDDYKNVLKAPVDIVDLCVPNHLHKPFAIEAANAGKHVICEKPLTGYFGEGEEAMETTAKNKMYESALRNADEMIEAAEKHGVKLMYAENWLYSPVIQKARRLVHASGGTILEIRAAECHSGSHASYAKRWEYSGGGALMRLGAHPIGIAVHLKSEEGIRRDGRPITVAAVTAETGDLTRIGSFRRESPKWLVTGWEGVENWSIVVLTFSDGSRAVLSASDVALGGMEDTLQIHLSNAHVKCDLMHSNILRAYAPDPSIFESEYIAEKLETKAGWSYPSIDEEWMLGYPQELRDFVEAVIHDREPLANGHLGRQVVEVIYAAYQSAEEGRRVTLAGA